MGLFDRTTARYGRSRAKPQAGQSVVSMSGGGAQATDLALGQHGPTTRELRAQVVHRLQVGLFGLSAMLLLVSLANVIMERAKLVDRAAVPDVTAAGPGTTASATPVNDPLVDLGVAPELPVGAKTAPATPSSPSRTGASKP
ncbi:hypothetical protein [Novosphingobium sp.]|uniref:hypothetical protein n=1 Tax=Novosphingobium sp. TaxID=1874826 RepID=UPI0038BE1512